MVITLVAILGIVALGPTTIGLRCKLVLGAYEFAKVIDGDTSSSFYSSLVGFDTKSLCFGGREPGG